MIRAIQMSDENPRTSGKIGPAAAGQLEAIGSGKSLDDIALLDEDGRPRAAAIRGATEAHRRQGRRLGLFHRHHLDELAAVRSALNRLVTGTGTLMAVSDSIASLSMGENYRTFGNLCGRQCLLLQMHHDIEEDSMYPILRQDAGLRSVLDRLSKEHETVHALLDRIQGALGSLASDPAREDILALRDTYDILERVVVSHFRYEEQELAEAIGFYDAL